MTRRELPTRQGGPARAAFEVDEWRYCSRREPLIAFSNHHFYDDDLVTFPSPDDLDGSTAVRFVHVPDGRWRSKAGFNPIEAKRIAELVLEHIQQYGSRSLGVITFTLRQQLAVLDELRKNRPDLEPFFREDRSEPFFVKNLENVQGDERDRIILSVAYGLNEETGRDSMSFGPSTERVANADSTWRSLAPARPSRW